MLDNWMNKKHTVTDTNSSYDSVLKSYWRDNRDQSLNHYLIVDKHFRANRKKGKRLIILNDNEPQEHRKSVGK